MSRDDPRMEGCGAVKIPMEIQVPEEEEVKYGPCCTALNTKCSACSAGMSIKEFCATRGRRMSRDDPRMEGCGPEGEVKYGLCCTALNTKCSACSAGMSIEEFCATRGRGMSRDDPRMEGCGAVKIPMEIQVPEEEEVKYGPCCTALNTKCSACSAGMSIKEFCATRGRRMSRDDPRMEGCEAVKFPPGQRVKLPFRK